MAPTPPKLIFGAGLFTKDNGVNSAEDVKPWLEVLLRSKPLVNEVDTAFVYQTSEVFLGELQFPSHFAIGTKLPGGVSPQPSSKEVIIAQAKASLRKLGCEQIDILCFHGPDVRVPLEDTLSGFDTLYKEGAFKRFSLANHTAEQVEEVFKICKDKGFVLPTVFEASYSAFARLPEGTLFPVLRKHKMAIKAYSPSAGGFLAKTSAQFQGEQESLKGGRWDKTSFLGGCYQFIYNNPDALAALDKWHEIAAAAGISGVEMAYRWVVHNSALDGSLGDGVVLGASSIAQFKSNLEAIKKGPLDEETAAKIDALWTPGVNSILDNWQAVQGMMAAKQKAASQ